MRGISLVPLKISFDTSIHPCFDTPAMRELIPVNRYKEWRADAKRKLRARQLTIIAIRNGTLTRQPCEDCGDTTKNSEAHHADYDKPLEVVWLCKQCHGKQHRGRKTEGQHVRTGVFFYYKTDEETAQ